MIDALITGRLHAKPERRTAKNGNAFATAKLRVASGDGQTLFASVICFDVDAVAALLALEAGDSVALAGTVAPKVWTPKGGEPRLGLDVVAHAVLTAYHVQRKRRAVAPPRAAASKDEAWRAGSPEPLEF